MKSIRVLLTDKCNEHCVNCINKSIRSESAFMDSRKLIGLSHYLRENGVERIRPVRVDFTHESVNYY